VSGDHFVLEIPAVPVHLGTARTFSSQIARHAGVDDAVVEDVKLAVSEACAGSVDRVGVGERVVIRSRLGPEVVVFEVEGGGDFAPDLSQDGPARLDLIRTLFPDTSLDRHDDGRTTIHFSFPLGG
jgi:anti-sigma regulatory factor (Ser/Thr protein kinase)